ncbi:lysophospholipid acyltransferase family protein [Ammoniphilus sp. YIM 78166]|uniref:lysophospholipid acyltransferase family protein n=1 Tax=Ammoniphilus sp. YIM 78166 TaxID=1644106 RepID=UPI001F0D6F6D|nr:lysophospholipid acyltransferase family protein [Ammoniphilus sp. YIM 78166]
MVYRWLHYIPKPLALFFCYCISQILYWASSDLRKLVYSNMKELLTEKPSKKLHRLTRSYFYQMTVVLYEILIESSSLDKVENNKFDVKGENYIKQELDQGKGVIIFTPHVGNFFYYYWYLTQRYPCLTVATMGSSELRPLYSIFENMGCRALDYDEVPAVEIVRQLKRHLANNGVVFLLGDFWRPNFPPARFFGRSTRTPAGSAMLSLEGKVPIIPMLGYRKKRFKHDIQFYAPVYLYQKWSPSQRSQAINELNEWLEEMVKTKPDQWFYWFNVNERWENENED